MRPAAPPPSSLRSGQRGLGGPGRGRSQGLEVPQALAAVTARLPARLPAAARGNEALWAPPFSRRISSRLRVEAQGRRRPAPPAATMCDCFHVVLPTWPGAPGSGQSCPLMCQSYLVTHAPGAHPWQSATSKVQSRATIDPANLLRGCPLVDVLGMSYTRVERGGAGQGCDQPKHLHRL
ncbi:hypothetical protein NN561_006871 [Cricetulus griseus]